MTPGATGTEVQGVPDFWTRVEAASEVFLILDYDGTLAPFRVDRMKAVPLDGVLEAIMTIRDSGRTRMALVSGRPLSELLELTGDLGVTMVGSHGFEANITSIHDAQHLSRNIISASPALAGKMICSVAACSHQLLQHL